MSIFDRRSGSATVLSNQEHQKSASSASQHVPISQSRRSQQSGLHRFSPKKSIYDRFSQKSMNDFPLRVLKIQKNSQSSIAEMAIEQKVLTIPVVIWPDILDGVRSIFLLIHNSFNSVIISPKKANEIKAFFKTVQGSF
jgi:hypothetical protein